MDILTILPFLVEREEKVDILTILGLGIAGRMTDLEKGKEKGKEKVTIILLPFLTGPRAKAKERAVIPIPMVREIVTMLISCYRIKHLVKNSFPMMEKLIHQVMKMFGLIIMICSR